MSGKFFVTRDTVGAFVFLKIGFGGVLFLTQVTYMSSLFIKTFVIVKSVLPGKGYVTLRTFEAHMLLHVSVGREGPATLLAADPITIVRMCSFVCHQVVGIA